MKQFSKFLALGLLFAAVPLAQADTVTFACGPAPNYSPCPLSGGLPTTAGLPTTHATASNFQGYDFYQTSTSTSTNPDGGAGTVYFNNFQGDPAPSLSGIDGASNTNDSAFEFFNAGSNSFILDDFSIATGSGSSSYQITEYLVGGGTVSFGGTEASNQAGCAVSGGYCYNTITAPTADQQYVNAVVFTMSTSGSSQTSTLIDQIDLSPNPNSNLSPPATPEPSSLLLLGTGLAGACGVLYRKRRASIA